MPLRLVADTNVLISATLWNSPDARILFAARDRHCDLFLSVPLLEELSGKLRDRKFEARLRQVGLTADDALSLVLAAATLIAPVSVAAPGLRDQGDLLVLEAAVGAQADVIVSKDKDLLTLKEFMGVPIMNAEDAASTLGLPRR